MRGLQDLTCIEQLGLKLAASSVKQQLAELRVLFDWMVVGQIVSTNHAESVRGPRYSVRKGKTTVLTADQARAMVDAIDITTRIACATGR